MASVDGRSETPRSAPRTIGEVKNAESDLWHCDLFIVHNIVIEGEGRAVKSRYLGDFSINHFASISAALCTVVRQPRWTFVTPDDIVHGRRSAILSRKDKIKRMTLERRKKENLRNAAHIEEMELEVLQVSLVRLGARRGEDLVLGSPDDQRRRLMLAQVRLPLWIERRVASVVVEQL